MVKNYLVNFGVKANRLEITSWGKERPIEVGCGEEVCHSKNRRVEFKIIELISALDEISLSFINFKVS